MGVGVMAGVSWGSASCPATGDAPAGAKLAREQPRGGRILPRVAQRRGAERQEGFVCFISASRDGELNVFAFPLCTELLSSQ